MANMNSYMAFRWRHNRCSWIKHRNDTIWNIQRVF